jgi:acyl-coenzyme A thioesterase PaaI-like protein
MVTSTGHSLFWSPTNCQKTIMSIWKQTISVEVLTASHVNTAVQRLGIEFLEVGDDFIRARVPVDSRTVQPYGLLHGGVSVVLAETLGSCGAAYSAPGGHRVVGLDINANHLKGRKQRLGHRHHTPGTHWPQHPGLGY